MNGPDTKADGFRVLVVAPPWSWAIRPGGKLTENRGPTARWKYRGPVLIQAGRRWDRLAGCDPALVRFADVPGLDRGAARYLLDHWHRPRPPEMFEPSKVVAAVDLVNVHTVGPDCRWWRSCRTWGWGDYGDAPATHLVFEHPHVFAKPLAAPHGQLGLYRPTTRLAMQALDQLLAANWPPLEYQEDPECAPS